MTNLHHAGTLDFKLGEFLQALADADPCPEEFASPDKNPTEQVCEPIVFHN
jgi:hypothetical protein